MGLTDNGSFDRYIALIEYEWAPIHRLGLEVEFPFTFYYKTQENGKAPSSELNSLKIAGQYSFWVSVKNWTTMAFGYIHEFEFTDIKNYSKGRICSGNLYNPFYIAAKRLGRNFHTLIYADPLIH